MKKNNISKLLPVSMIFALAVSMTGHAAVKQNTAPQKEKDTAVGTIILKASPKIKIDYNNKGQVLKLKGLNESGRNVVDDMKNYKYDSCDDILEELIWEIQEDGHFDKKDNQPAKTIFIKLESGSIKPDKYFLEDLEESARTAVMNCDAYVDTIIVRDTDSESKDKIGIEKARELALKHAGLKNANFLESDYDAHNNIYEFEFTANGVEYEYKINAVTGQISHVELESIDNNHPWDDDNRYDDNDRDDDDHDDDDHDDDHDDDD